jgi:hypothetical protein
MSRRAQNSRVAAARRARNERIRTRFAYLYNQGLRWDIVVATLVEEYQLAESTLAQIVKRQGYYNEQPQTPPEDENI